jgi:hypothetical protein
MQAWLTRINYAEWNGGNTSSGDRQHFTDWLAAGFLTMIINKLFMT